MNKSSLVLNIVISCLIMIGGLFLYHNFFGSDIQHIDNTEPRFAEVSLSEGYISRYHQFSESSFAGSFIEAAEKSKPSVVYIISYEKIKGSLFSKGYKREKGSGVVVSEDGYIVTNAHVVSSANFIEITLEDKREFVAEIVGIDQSTDLALLKIEATNLPFLIFGNSDSLHVGEWILAIGNPFGLQSTVTAGIVSAKARNIEVLDKNDIESFIQSDAVINPGSSGGALININGLLMGICTAIISSTGNYEGLSFAVPSNLARKVVIDLKQFGSVQRGKLGISITDVNARIAREQGMTNIVGVFISSVNLNSAGALGGLAKGDIILNIENAQIISSAQFYEQINRYRPGDVIAVTYFRKEKIKTTSIKLRNYLNTTEYLTVRSDKILKDIGIEIRDLNSFEKERMKSNGIMIISVSKGSIIADTNMEPGFIVEEINGRKVETALEFIQLIKNAKNEVELKGFYERYPGQFPYTFLMSE